MTNTRLFKMTEEEFRQARIRFAEAKMALEGLADEALVKMMEDGFDGLTPVEEVDENMYYLEFRGMYVASLKAEIDIEYIEENKLRIHTRQALQNVFIPHHSFYNFDNKESFKEEDIKAIEIDGDFYIVDEKSNKRFLLEEKSNRTLAAIQEELEKELLKNRYVDFES